MKTIYMDESGYTGAKLLDVNQPIQGASSILIDEDTAKNLVDEYFPQRQTNELKHSKLSRKRSNWKNLLEIQKIALNEYMGFTYVCHKKYLLVLMFLDSCVEPAYYSKGFNFYENGQNFSMTSLILATAPHFWEMNNLDELLYFYQRAAKTKSDLNINVLIDKAKSLNGRKLSEFLLPLILLLFGKFNSRRIKIAN